MNEKAQRYIEYVESLKAEKARKKISGSDVLPDWLVPVDQSKCSLRWLAHKSPATCLCGKPAQVTVQKDPAQVPLCLDCGLNKALEALNTK